VVLAARQCIDMTDRPVVVVPTRNAAEGFAALLALDPTLDASANVAPMTEAARSVQTLVVTEAVRDATIGGRKVKRGGTIVINVTDASKLPSIAEPFFLDFSANVSFHPCMTPEDLGKAGLDDGNLAGFFQTSQIKAHGEGVFANGLDIIVPEVDHRHVVAMQRKMSADIAADGAAAEHHDTLTHTSSPIAYDVGRLWVTTRPHGYSSQAIRPALRLGA